MRFIKIKLTSDVAIEDLQPLKERFALENISLLEANYFIFKGKIKKAYSKEVEPIRILKRIRQ
jgi:hypothetical protein